MEQAYLQRLNVCLETGALSLRCVQRYEAGTSRGKNVLVVCIMNEWRIMHELQKSMYHVTNKMSLSFFHTNEISYTLL